MGLTCLGRVGGHLVGVGPDAMLAASRQLEGVGGEGLEVLQEVRGGGFKGHLLLQAKRRGEKVCKRVCLSHTRHVYGPLRVCARVSVCMGVSVCVCLSVRWCERVHPHLLRVVSAAVHQLVPGDLVVRAALRGGHPGEEDAGL